MNNKLLRFGLLLISSLCFIASLTAQTPAAPKLEFPAASPAATLKQRVGITDIEINYSRPSMKGRVIFGGLLPFDKVWRTGANNATKISFSTPVKLNGTDVAAGVYALFTIPGKEEWTVILNKVTGQWGAYAYDAKNDVARIKAKPIAMPTAVESFSIGIADLRDASATIFLTWEKTHVPVSLTVDTKGILVPQIEAAMAAGGEKLPYAPAAMFYLENGLDLKKALTWIDAGIAAEPKAFYFVYRKALIQEKMGDKAGALATAQASLDAANKADGAIKEEYVGLNQALIKRLQ